MVAEAVGDVDVEFAEGAGADPRSYRVDFSKIAETLGGFAPGMGRCVAASGNSSPPTAAAGMDARSSPATGSSASRG